MASIQDARDELNRILKELELVIEKNPNDAPAFFKKGLALSELGKKKDAILAFNQAIAINPNDAYAFISKGNALSALGKNEEAIDAFNQAIAIDPNDAYVFSNKGRVLSALGKNEEALLAYDQAIAINPKFADAFYFKGNALSALGKKKEAIDAFNQAIAINPNDAYAFISKGRILSALGKKKEAIDAYDQAIAVDPNDAYVTAISLDPSLFDKIKHQNLIKEILNNLREYLDEKKLLIDVITRFSNNQYLAQIFQPEHHISVLKNIYSIFFCISLIQKILIVDRAENDNFYHYTNLETLSKLLNASKKKLDKKEGITLRLYNTDYMNDPMEGSFLYETIFNKTSLRKKITDLEEQFEIVSHSFISSLTFKNSKDELPLWRMYGKNGQGVVLGFQGLSQINQETEITNKPLSFESNEEDKKYINQPAQLYKVIYLNKDLLKDMEKNKESDFSDQELCIILLNEINKYLSELSNLFSGQQTNDLEDKYKELEELVPLLIATEMDKIKYLIKDEKYAYEEEYRLLQLTDSFNNEDCIHDIDNPKLFFELKNLKISEIIFGPKCNNFNEWIPFIHQKLQSNGDRVKIKLSDIRYR